MTSKRKVIISALGKNGLSTMDDLGFHTGIVRKSLHDNVKAAVQDGLVERTMDDITRHPAYLLTAKGRDWLVKNQNEVSGEQPQPTVGQNIGSDESASHVVGSLIAEPPSEVVTVIEPPKPDEAPGNTPAAVRSNAIPPPDYDPRSVSFNPSERERALLDQRQILDQALTLAQGEVDAGHKVLTQQRREIELLNEMLADHEQMAMNQVQIIKDLQAENEAHQIRIGQLEGNEELPLQYQTPDRFIITDSYVIVKTEAEANNTALRMAADIDADSPVVVFAPIKARELRINWRDA